MKLYSYHFDCVFFLHVVEEFLREAKEKFEEQWKNQSQVSITTRIYW
jgi:hypothetical protein